MLEVDQKSAVIFSVHDALYHKVDAMQLKGCQYEVLKFNVFVFRFCENIRLTFCVALNLCLIFCGNEMDWYRWNFTGGIDVEFLCMWKDELKNEMQV